MTESEREWIYAVDGKRQGPLSAREIATLISGDRLAPDTLVWKPGMNDWHTAADVREIAALCAPRAPGFMARVHRDAESRSEEDEWRGVADVLAEDPQKKQPAAPIHQSQRSSQALRTSQTPATRPTTPGAAPAPRQADAPATSGVKKTISFWAVCALAFIVWKLVFSTEVAKDLLKPVFAPGHELGAAQVKQIEDIARGIAVQSNANKQAMLDEMTASFDAIATGRNVRFESVLRTKKGLPPNEVKEWLDATRGEIIPRACAQNANNEAFDRGLSYTFSYSNTYGERLGDIFVDKTTCKTLGL